MNYWLVVKKKKKKDLTYVSQLALILVLSSLGFLIFFIMALLRYNS